MSGVFPPITLKIKLIGPIACKEFHEINLRIIGSLQRYLKWYFYPDVHKATSKWSPLLLSLQAFLEDLIDLPHLLTRNIRSFFLAGHTLNILIVYYQKINLHVGPAALLSIISHNLWIPAVKFIPLWQINANPSSSQ